MYILTGVPSAGRAVTRWKFSWSAVYTSGYFSCIGSPGKKPPTAKLSTI